MPEGDTVWRTARHLDQTLSGRVLTKTDFRVPALATVDLAGQTVTSTVSRGKHLLTRIGPTADTGHTLHTHLKMEGSWHLYRPDSPWMRPAHEARVVLTTDEWVGVGFALGITELLARDEEESAVGHLGPDLLGSDWDEDEAVRRLLADPEVTMADALLDQTKLAGVGNMYRSELCFLGGIAPTRRVAEVSDVVRLVRRAKAMLEANKERVEQTTTGDLRRGRRTWVYRRDREPCRRCGTPIQVTMQGPDGKERAIYWCPRCQSL
jgi:endonuclease-8